MPIGQCVASGASCTAAPVLCLRSGAVVAGRVPRSAGDVRGPYHLVDEDFFPTLVTMPDDHDPQVRIEALHGGDGERDARLAFDIIDLSGEPLAITVC
jgi:hypothetical protein